MYVFIYIQDKSNEVSVWFAINPFEKGSNCNVEVKHSNNSVRKCTV